MIEKRKKLYTNITFAFLCALAALFLVPIALVFINSFKSRLYVSSAPFALPFGEMGVGLENYINGLSASGFLQSFLRSVFISVAGVLLIIVCTSMTAWYIVRVKGKITQGLYYLFVFSMIVPFQMVMYTMAFVVNRLHFDNVFGIVWSSGIQILLFLAALQNIPPSAREAAQIEGATAWEYFWKITFPCVSPFILANLIFTVIDSFTNPMNRVMRRIMLFQTEEMNYGLSSAMTWLYFGIVLIAIGAAAAIINRFIYYEFDS